MRIRLAETTDDLFMGRKLREPAAENCFFSLSTEYRFHEAYEFHILFRFCRMNTNTFREKLLIAHATACYIVKPVRNNIYKKIINYMT